MLVHELGSHRDVAYHPMLARVLVSPVALVPASLFVVALEMESLCEMQKEVFRPVLTLLTQHYLTQSRKRRLLHSVPPCSE